MRKPDRPGPKRLYLSSHLATPLRHVQLEFAGAPMRQHSFMDLVAFQTGTLWHEHVAQTLRNRRLPVMQEVSITRYLPLGWGGTVDLVAFNEETDRWHVMDLKTTTGEAMDSIFHNGPKVAHLWQVSAYHMALSDMGFELDDDVSVYYLPKNAVRGKNVEPVMHTVQPLFSGVVREHMMQRKTSVDSYLEAVKDTGLLENDWLADEPEHVQKLFTDKKTGVKELKLVPGPYAAYCPFDPELCGCSQQGQTKIGEYDKFGFYIPRKGYEEILPELDADGRPTFYEHTTTTAKENA